MGRHFATQCDCLTTQHSRVHNSNGTKDMKQRTFSENTRNFPFVTLWGTIWQFKQTHTGNIYGLL